MKKLPDGFRWVEVKDNGCSWGLDPRILISNINKKFQCVNLLDHGDFLRGENYDIVIWDEAREIQEPKKIPYTYETFPVWAVWVRNKNWDYGLRDSITSVMRQFIEAGGDVSLPANRPIRYEDIDNWEIAGVDGEWKSFYTTK